MSDYLINAVGPAKQNEITHPSQVQNDAGGYSFEVTDRTRLDRFLILGSEGGTYYADERKLTRENAGVVSRMARVDGAYLVGRIVEISDSGRAPKNDPAILALAIAAKEGSELTRELAYRALPRVCRTGTHLFTFVALRKQLGGGWGRGLVRAIGNWYGGKSVSDLAYSLAKYQSRDGWSNADLLRLAHPGHGGAKVPSADHAALYRWAQHGYDACAMDGMILPPLIEAFEEAKATDSVKRLCTLIAQYNLPRECVPTKWLAGEHAREVWDVLLHKMPPHAMIRNLATMTRVGLLVPMSEALATVKTRLADADLLKRKRVHPISILTALMTYRLGRSIRGTSTWQPVQGVLDALDTGFYASFGAVPSTGKATLLAIDVSGSMESGVVAGIPGLTPRIAAAAMALVTANAEPRHHLLGFSAPARGVHGGHWGGGSPGLTDLKISPKMRLDQVIEAMKRVPMGGTDCSLPMMWATSQLAHGVKVESFSVYTDNETWWPESVHPHVALKQYRQASGVAARLAVVTLTPTEFSIANPDDAGMSDFVGFDSATPALLADFFGGGPNPTHAVVKDVEEIDSDPE